LQLLTMTGKLINHVVDAGAPLCYVAVDEVRDLVYGANYHKGEVLVYKRAADGSSQHLLTKTCTQALVLTRIKPSPHVHFTDLTPDQYLIIL
jgi:6-phosphogluconolactonase